MTTGIKKARYVYYHCTGGRGPCGTPTSEKRITHGDEAYREWVLPRMIEKGLLPKDTKLPPINPLAQ